MSEKKIKLTHDSSALDPSYLLTYFVGDKSVGDSFVDWPLHITIIPWFFVHDIDVVTAELKRIADEFSKSIITCKKLTKFGERTVSLLDGEDALVEIHRSVYSCLQKHDARFIDTRYFGDNYTPHVTWQESGSFELGDKANITSFYLVKRQRDNQTGRYIKTIAKEFSLNA